jgi:hypothetical protein
MHRRLDNFEKQECKIVNTDYRHSRVACVVGAKAPYNYGVLLAGAGGNPAKIKPRAARQHPRHASRCEDNLINWIPACSGMKERRLLSLILTLLLTTPVAQAEGLGRLFFTPAQRTQLNNHQYLPIAAPVTTPEVLADMPEETERSLTVNGIVQRNGGKRTAWINGTAKAVESSDESPSSVTVNLPDQNKKVRLKVGQRVLLSPPANAGTAKPDVEKPAVSDDD